MRNSVKLLMFLIALAVLPAFAAEITNTSGKVFFNAQVKSVRPDGLNVSHSKGIAFLPFQELSDSMKAEYGYDAKKAAEFQKTKADQEAWLRTPKADWEAQHAIENIEREWKEEYEEEERSNAEGRIVSLNIIQIVDGGALSEITGVTHGSGSNTEFRTIAQPKTVFVYGVPDTLVDGNSFSTFVYPCGRYQYVTVQGGQRTVERYATTRSAATKLLNEE